MVCFPKLVVLTSPVFYSRIASTSASWVATKFPKIANPFWSAPTSLPPRTKGQQQGRRDPRGQRAALGRKLAGVADEQAKAITLANDVAVLARGLGVDVFAVSALPFADRCTLFNFLVVELQTRASQCPHRLGPVCSRLKNHRDQLLAFALQLDDELAQVVAAFTVPVGVVREMFDLPTRDSRQPLRWQKEAALREGLRGRFHALEQAVGALRQQVVRASSILENLNSRVRRYFFLRRELGSGYRELLQFFLTHRRFWRSAHPERVAKSPAELLRGQTHLHGLEMLGYRPSGRT